MVDDMNSKTDEKVPFIEVKDLAFAYEDADGNRHDALKGVSLAIPKGQFLAVLGHNGSGKSTFAKLLNMILLPDKGEIYVDGELVSSPVEPDEETVFAVRRRIGMVHQNPDNQIVASVVEEDVAFGPENLGVMPEEIRRRVDASLDAVGMREYAIATTSHLSGGQKQRIAIAGVIAMLPECIIFDESTSMLDPSGRSDVMKTIQYLNRERGITIVHITHDMSEAALADRIVVLSDGELFLDGTPDDIFSKPDKLREVALDVPQSVSLLHELNRKVKGFRIPDVITDPDGCADYICMEFERLGLSFERP